MSASEGVSAKPMHCPFFSIPQWIRIEAPQCLEAGRGGGRRMEGGSGIYVAILREDQTVSVGSDVPPVERREQPAGQRESTFAVCVAGPPFEEEVDAVTTQEKAKGSACGGAPVYMLPELQSLQV